MPNDTDSNAREREPVLETERLLLRRFTLEDAPFAFDLVNDPAWIQYIGDRNVRSIEDARGYLQKGPIAMYERAGFGMWVMTLKDTGVPVGTCGLIRRESLDDVDIGFAMLPQHRGKGLALEASRAVLEYAWRVVGLARVVAIVSPDNAKSIRLLETIGMRFEKKIRLPQDDEEISLYAWERVAR